MANSANDLARLAALQKRINQRLAQYGGMSVFDFDSVLLFLKQYDHSRKNLQKSLPDLFFDLPERSFSEAGHLESQNKRALSQVIEDMSYIFEVRANCELPAPSTQTMQPDRPARIFISHGRSADWREVQAFIERDLSLPTLELAQQPNQGRTVLQKLSDESEGCSFAVVVMTGDDSTSSDAPRVRENVMHEIGFFQGKYGLANVCLLHEEGVSIPTNIHGVVYIPFPKGLVSASFGVLLREVRAAFPQ